MAERLTQEQADRLAKWRWGPAGYAISDSHAVHSVTGGTGLLTWFGASFEAAFRASMQRPMTDQDAELEAKLRWGMNAAAWTTAAYRIVGGRGMCLVHEPWETAFADADRSACPTCGCRLIEGETVAARCPGGRCDRCAERTKERPGAHHDLTPAEAMAEAKARWGAYGYALAWGDGTFAVGGPGGTIAGSGNSFRDAFWRAYAAPLQRVFEGVARAIQQDENKRVGYALAKSPPGWAYPAGWRYAVMAAVEQANTSIVALSCFSNQDARAHFTESIKRYHRLRLAGHTIEAALPGGLLRAPCEAYERGRGVPGGGR